MIRAVLYRACRLARRWSANTLPSPFADAELPTWRLAERRDAVRSPSIEEVRALIAAAEAEDLRVGTFIRLLAAKDCAAARRALRWVEALVTYTGGVTVRGPKTRASVRGIAVDASTIDQLRRLRDHQVELAVAAGAEVGGDSFVFSYESGGQVPLYPDTLSHAFSALRDRAGVAADVHLHSLRHFQSTELDRVISESQKQARLGWSTVHMARHYTGAVSAEDRRAAEHMDSLLG